MTPEQWRVLEFAAYGAGAALVAAMAKEGRLQAPRVYAERNRDGQTVRFIDPGFLGSVLLGAGLALYFDGRPQTAAAYGMAAGYAGPAILNAVIGTVLRRLGVELGASATETQRHRGEKGVEGGR